MVMVMTREKDPRPETASAGRLQVVVSAADVLDLDGLQQVLTRLGAGYAHCGAIFVGTTGYRASRSAKGVQPRPGLWTGVCS